MLIELVRHEAKLDDEGWLRFSALVFGVLDGLGALNQKRWRKFWQRVLQLELGEMVTITITRQRLGWFHRKHMVMETRVFEGQERFEHFEQFRNWVKIGAGHCDWVPGPKGAVVPIPKSISYSSIEQGAFEEFHSAACAFLRTPHALKVMWPKASPAVAAQGLEDLLESFGAFAA